MSFFLPGRRPLTIPGTSKRVLRRPDARGLIVPQMSGAPLTAGEVDYDELDIVRSWRTYEPDAPGQVRYFCYELAQTDPGAPAERYFKVVRFFRLTRVPRYLRNTGSSGGEMFSAMRDVLVGLREKRVLFVNLIAKSPQMPLVFAYGVQGTGDTFEAACVQADDAYAALTFALDGTYQQLEYSPLTLGEGELLARYQAEWDQIAMARGRPMPQGVALGSSAILDGNRTDVENTNNQLESFIRGMGDKSFMLSLVTAPLSPADMTTAWNNVVKKLSAARSDQQGQRGVSAGVALPLGTGVSMGDTSGTTHGLTGTHGIGSTDGLSAGTSQGLSYTHTDGTSASESLTNTVGTSQSVSDSLSTSTALGNSLSVGESVTATDGASRSDSFSAGQSLTEGVNQGVSQSLTEGVSTSSTDSATASQSVSTSEAVAVGQSATTTQGVSVSDSRGVTTGASLSDAVSAGSNWANTVGRGLSAGQSLSSGISQSMGETLSQTWNLGFNGSDSLNAGGTRGDNQSVGSGIPGLNLGAGTSRSETIGSGLSASHGVGVSQAGGGTFTSGLSESFGQSFGDSLNFGESQGGSLSRTQTAGASVGESQTVTAGQSLSSAIGQSATQSAGVSQGVGSSLSHAESVGQSLATAQATSAGQSLAQGLNTGVGQSMGASQSLASGQSATQGTSLTQAVAEGRTVGTGQSASTAAGVSQGVSASDATSVSAQNSSGASTALSRQQAMSDAAMVAMSRQASQSASLGVVPTITASISKATFDEGKRVVGDILEAQMKRYQDGIEGGGLLYQMFLVCPDRETLIGASSLLKSAFWGSGGDQKRLPQPFHTQVIDEPTEARRLLTHAAAFSSYRRREPVVELIEPYMYSSFVTTGECSAFCHPPTSEALGLQAQVDSMPVLAMPYDRAERDMYLGRIINGERGRVSDAKFGIDLDEVTHMLIQGTTGLGKTTTMMRILEQAARLERDVVTPPTPQRPWVETTKARAGALCLDWMQNMRDLANVVPADRFQLFSVANPNLGAFRFNPLEIPHEGMDPGQWLGSQADNLAASFGLGQFGRSLIAEVMQDLYTANRLEPFDLRPAVIADDGTGTVLRDAITLPPVDPADLPASAIRLDAAGERYANVFTCPRLSRLVSLSDVAVMIARKVEEAATTEGARLLGTAMRDRLQSVWRRLQYYTPDQPMGAMVAADPDLSTRECLGVTDLIDPDRGLVTVIELDGLDLENRRVILGSVMLAVYRFGLHVGKGCYDHGGRGPGTFVVLEESHELFGAATEGEDKESAAMRASLYESLFRRARATGLRLVAMTQNCGALPSAVTSQTTTVLIHRTYDPKDRERVFSLLNWSNQIGQQMREWRYLGEMPRGYCIARLDARESYLESAPVQLLVDPPDLPPVSDAQLQALAQARATRV